MTTPLIHTVYSIGSWSANVTDSFGVRWGVAAQNVFDGPGIKLNQTPKPYNHGSFRVNSFKAARSITLQGWADCPDRSSALQARTQLLALFADGGQSVFVINDGFTTRQALVELVDIPKVAFAPDARSFDWQLSLSAVDPRYYDTMVQSAFTTLPTPGNVGLDWSTGGGLDWGLPNYAPNPGFEDSTVGWTPLHSSTLARQAGGSVGSFSCLVTSTQSSTSSGLISAGLVRGLQPTVGYTFSADVKPSATSTMALNVDWFNSSDTYLSTTFVSTAGVTAGTWQTITSTHTSPANATAANIYPDGGLMAVGASFGVDNLVFRPTAATGTGTGLNWGTTAINGTFPMTNTGNADCWPTFTLTGPLTLPIITDNNTGQQLVYNDTLASGDTLVISTSPFERSVLLSGSDRRALLTSAQWFPIPPNSSVTVALAASAGSGSLSASWRNASW